MVGDGLNSPRYQGGRAAALGDDSNGPALPDKFSMQHSRTLDAKDKKLGKIPDSIFRDACSSSVVKVNLEGNLLTKVPDGLQEMENQLTELMLARNKIPEIPTYISKFTMLNKIDLSSNFLSSLPDEFGTLESLAELNISHNRFADVPGCIYRLLGLSILIANDNRLKSIDASMTGIGAFKHLTKLDLSNNDIQVVPPILGNITSIKRLKLVGNPFRQPRHHILCMGTEATLKYLRDRIPN